MCYLIAVSGRTWLLLSWILVGWVLLTVHAVVLCQAVRAHRVEKKWRWLSLIPPVAPVVAWHAGRRVAPILWGVVLVAYLALRAFES